MRSFFIVTMLLVPVLFSDLAYAQTPVQGTSPAPEQQEASDAPAVPTPQSRINVDLKDDLLSVDLYEADFRSVLQALSVKGGIKVDMAGDIGKRKLTTKFSGIDLERGILRLMTLMKEKNYTLKYDNKGRVNLIEIYASSPAATGPPKTAARNEPPKTSPSPGTRADKPVSGLQKNPPQQQRLIPPPGQQPLRDNTASKATRVQKKNAPEAEDDEADVEDLPYIPPQKRTPVKPQ